MIIKVRASPQAYDPETAYRYFHSLRQTSQQYKSQKPVQDISIYTCYLSQIAKATATWMHYALYDNGPFGCFSERTGLLVIRGWP